MKTEAVDRRGPERVSLQEFKIQVGLQFGAKFYYT